MRLLWVAATILCVCGCAQKVPIKEASWKDSFPAGFFAPSRNEPAHRVESPPKIYITVQVGGNVANRGEIRVKPGASLVDVIIAAGGAYDGGIIGGSYNYMVKRGEKRYSLNARNGFSELNAWIVEQGDEIFAAM